MKYKNVFISDEKNFSKQTIRIYSSFASYRQIAPNSSKILEINLLFSEGLPWKCG